MSWNWQVATRYGKLLDILGFWDEVEISQFLEYWQRGQGGGGASVEVGMKIWVFQAFICNGEGIYCTGSWKLTSHQKSIRLSQCTCRSSLWTISMRIFWSRSAQLGVYITSSAFSATYFKHLMKWFVKIISYLVRT